MRITHLRLAALLILFSCGPAGVASAQVFGKNKVHYEALHWSVLETPHLRLHYYAQEESLARRLAAVAESVCVEFDGRFRLQFRQKIPFLLYSTHHLFQQTNATPSMISEAVGGLTELIKGRVLVPHVGSWSRLLWVTRHELAHAYMLEKLARVMRDHRRNQTYLPPLWFIEGLAEYCATTWDADAEGLLRDAVITGRATPLTRSDAILGSVLMYKEGQSFLLYVDQRFGSHKVFDLMDNWHKADDFETAFRLTFGERLADVDEQWFTEIKRRYYPTVATTTRARERGKRITPKGHYNLAPRALMPAPGQPDSAVRFCYFAGREGAIELKVSEPTRKGRRERRLLRAGQSTSFESFHLFQNRPDASADGRVALAVKQGGRDALVVLDEKQRRITREATFPTLVMISDPALVLGADAVVFSAQDFSGRSDLYRATWSGQKVKLERMTNDEYDDVDPDVSPDGRWVVFASDRGGRAGRYQLFRISLEDGRLEVMSQPGAGDDRQPSYSPDGRWLVFRSTRNGTSDLYVRTAEPSQETRRLTSLMGPASDPDWLPDGSGVLFCGQERVEFQVYELRFDAETLRVEPETPATPPLLASTDPETEMVEVPISQQRDIPQVAHSGPSHAYERRLGLDLVQNGLAYDPALGGVGGGNVVLSDVLGNEQLFLYLGSNAELGDFWDGLEAGFTYINQAHRLNYGLGLFRLTQVYDVDLDLVRRERRVGILGLAMYPLNRFTRVEGSVLIRHASDYLLRNGDLGNVDLVSNFVSVVHDNSAWTRLGPSNGWRMSMAAGLTRDLTSGAGDYTTLRADARHYIPLAPLVVSATRVQGQASLGRDAQSFYLGFPTIRGLGRRSIWGDRTLLVQQELRLPVIESVVFGFPGNWVFPTISAAAFADAAWAWDDGFQRERGSLGAGVYVGGGYFPAIRWNFAWTTSDFKTFTKKPRTQFSIAYNF